MKVAAIGLLIGGICTSGYIVGRADGVREERRRAWTECNQRIEAVSSRVKLVRLADPCGGQ